MVDLDWLYAWAERWHEAWEILGAIGSAFAALVALWLASRERVDRQAAERDRDEAREAQKRAELAETRRMREAQARSVVVWADHLVDVLPTGRRNIARVGAANYSDKPIMDVRFRIDGEALPLVLDHVDRSSLPVLHPEMSTTASHVGGPTTPANDDIGAEFRDAAGVWWRRSAAGGLEELSPTA